MEDTIFDKIVRREIPAEIVYEDDDTLAFMDIMPDAAGHTLVIPKKPSKNLFDIDAESWAKVMSTVRKLAPGIRDAVGASGMQIRMNNGAVAGQQVFHTHVHLIPFFEGQETHFPPQVMGDKAELAAVAEKIRKTLA